MLSLPAFVGKKAIQQLSFSHLSVFLSSLEQGSAEPRECRMSEVGVV